MNGIKWPNYLVMGVLAIGFLLAILRLVQGTGLTTAEITALASLTPLLAVALIVLLALNRIRKFSGGGWTAEMEAQVQARIQPIQEEVKDQKTKVNQQEKTIQQQQQIINDLVVYSLAAQPYEILWRLANTPQYIYHNTDNVRRWMNVLLDNGFIELKAPGGWLEFNDTMDGKNLVDSSKPTPAGHFLISLRGHP
jgi:hypothetical protein